MYIDRLRREGKCTPEVREGDRICGGDGAKMVVISNSTTTAAATTTTTTVTSFLPDRGPPTIREYFSETIKCLLFSNY